MRRNRPPLEVINLTAIDGTVSCRGVVVVSSGGARTALGVGVLVLDEEERK